MGVLWGGVWLMFGRNGMNTAVRAGYKLTEVGVIPEDWDISPIGDIFTVTAGGDFDSCCSSLVQDECFLFPIYSNALSSQGLYGYCEYAEHAANSITVTARGLVGSANYRNHKFTAIGRVLVLRPREESDGRFFAEFINERIAFAVESTGVPQLTAPQISSYKLPVPPLPVQRAIATALSDVDALLTKLDQLIAKKRDIKQAAMQQLLTGQTRLPGFSGDWEVKRLDALADIRGGGTPSTNQSDYWNGDIPWCTPTDITNLSGCKYLHHTARKITNKGLQSSSAELIPANSVVMTSRATIGECAINIKPVSTNQGFKNFIPYSGTDSDFLYYLLQNEKQNFLSLCSGSTFLELGKTQLVNCVVRIPEKTEQTAIATILSDMDTELAALKARRDKTRALKQGMMQELLTGNIRLP